MELDPTLPLLPHEQLRYLATPDNIKTAERAWLDAQSLLVNFKKKNPQSFREFENLHRAWQEREGLGSQLFISLAQRFIKHPACELYATVQARYVRYQSLLHACDDD